MPRHKKVHFRLKKSVGSRKSGIYAIYLEFIYDGTRRLHFGFGQTVKLVDWDLSRERVKKKNTTTADGKFELNALLDELDRLCLKTYYELLKGGIPEPEVLRSVLNSFFDKNHVDKPENTLYNLAERFASGEIKNKGKDRSEASLTNYKSVIKHLKDFETDMKYGVDFETIDLAFFQKYVTYLKTNKKLAHNTIAKDISIIKVFMGEALDLEYTQNVKFKSRKFSFPEEETYQVYLNEDELGQLYDFKVTNEKLEKVRDLFIFGAWTGLRFSDYSDIQPEHIIEEKGKTYIKRITHKTKAGVMIPCARQILEIFEKYNENANRLPRAISNQKFNKYLKIVCKDAGFVEVGRQLSNPTKQLWELVSSHTARRSFATNFYLRRFPAISLMQITGHTTEKAFLKYIRVSKAETARLLGDHMQNFEEHKNLMLTKENLPQI